MMGKQRIEERVSSSDISTKIFGKFSKNFI